MKEKNRQTEKDEKRGKRERDDGVRHTHRDRKRRGESEGVRKRETERYASWFLWFTVHAYFVPTFPRKKQMISVSRRQSNQERIYIWPKPSNSSIDAATPTPRY